MSMKTNNPYVNTLIESGYDEQDCSTPSRVEKTFPCVIHGRTFDTKEQYDEELAEYMMGM